MLKFSAWYINTNNNFVIQNIKWEKDKNSQYFSWLAIIKNILQRWNVTKLSDFLKTKYDVTENEVFKPLISNVHQKRYSTIKWSDENNYNPAKDFFNKIPEIFWEQYAYIQNLLCPEVKINEITQVYCKDFVDQQVDFYLQQAFLVIEIDWKQHGERNQNELDKKRDDYLKWFWINTIRINVADIKNKTETFNSKIDEIKKHISDEMDRQNQDDKYEKKLKSYNSISNWPDKIWLELTWIMRIQLTIIELLLRWQLNFWNDEIWNIEILWHNDFSENFINNAINDLFLWFENIFALQWIVFERPQFNIKLVKDFNLKSDIIKIDLWIKERRTDNANYNKEIVYIRTDYFDNYRDKNWKICDVNYFCLETNTPYVYKEKNIKEPLLQFFLSNLIWYKEFRPKQFAIIKNILKWLDTVWLLPTWSWKSLCYHLACLLQPAVSFVICPLISLMQDQKKELQEFGIDRIEAINSAQDSWNKSLIISKLRQKKFFFVFISPERFQTNEFRSSIKCIENPAYAVIDEIHCLSERWHDFRTSYLCLSKTIKNIFLNIKFLWLTATASINVLKDIQAELNIDDDSIIYLTKYERPELKFIVLDDKNNKLQETLKILEEENQIIWNGSPKPALIFTPTVNWNKWCFQIMSNLKNNINIYKSNEIGYFCWKMPNNYRFSQNEFDKEKENTLLKFKKWELKLICATKAFWMWINKKDIYFTIHYWIPSSMEALYQEWWRAWRDKENLFKMKNSAKCFVLFWKEKNEEVVNEIFKPESNYEDISNYEKKLKRYWDLRTQIFLWKNSINSIKIDKEKIISLYNILLKDNRVILSEEWEHYLYKLMILWIVYDYTVTWAYKKYAEVEFAEISCKEIKNNLINYILKYDEIESFNKYESQWKGGENLEKYVTILLQWSYDHHAYNRRQSLKNLYENCVAVLDNKLTNEQFKHNLEAYFKINKKTSLIQDIVDDSSSIDQRTNVFIKKEQLISLNALEELKQIVWRFLESYQNNIALNLISWFIRLFLWDFDDVDWKKRFENALDMIFSKDKQYQIDRLNEILDVWKYLNEDSKILLSELLIKYYKKTLKIYNELKDNYSKTYLLNMINTKLLYDLKNINDKH